jgi:hypothetical protein
LIGDRAGHARTGRNHGIVVPALIRGAFVIIGEEPDGESVRVVADDPTASIRRQICPQEVPPAGPRSSVSRQDARPLVAPGCFCEDQRRGRVPVTLT